MNGEPVACIRMPHDVLHPPSLLIRRIVACRLFYSLPFLTKVGTHDAASFLSIRFQEANQCRFHRNEARLTSLAGVCQYLDGLGSKVHLRAIQLLRFTRSQSSEQAQSRVWNCNVVKLGLLSFQQKMLCLLNRQDSRVGSFDLDLNVGAWVARDPSFRLAKAKELR